ncbi:5-carboxymethyl-2-hydroxymuconate Delta-isomerase [Actibacterium sp. MT2.3-13A]|uniref:5-carboxymethyl-2-hydroxymuconate Delta-isomerase n=1 Tax=Actibacterium sp. MT2.3-13A TaxID=2828332 RepID=UPI001BA9B030|nr:5-carboxymethyl-2-hydroxymuconate Delta-isomerase [Actibacterium sp. MT2.3-13A]
MPHIVIDYSEGLDETHDLHALCRSAFEAAAATGVFADPSAIKVRARPCPYFLLGADPQSFAHVDVHLLDGRSPEQKSTVTHAVLKALETHLPTVGSLTVDIHDIARASYAKRAL